MAATKQSKMARRCGLREIEVHFGMIDYRFWCVVGPRERVVDYVAWRLESPISEFDREKERQALISHGLGRMYERGDYEPVLWIPRRPRTAKEYGTLVHELGHIVRSLMEWADIELSEKTDEAYCHALGYGMERILSELRS